MLQGTAEYNKAASSAYNSLDEREKQKLRDCAQSIRGEESTCRSIREITRMAAKTFEKVTNLVSL